MKNTVDQKFPVLLTHQDIKRIKSEVAEIDAQLSPVNRNNEPNVGHLSHSQSQIVDRAELMKAKSERVAQLERLTPKKLKGNQEREAYSWCKDFEKWAAENMPSVNQDRMMYPKGVGTPGSETDFETAIQRNIAWMKSPVQQRVQIYKHLMARIDPSRPVNLERLRRPR